MAKTDNLTDFLTGVANAIRTKKGTTAKINPQSFEMEIENIQAGILPTEYNTRYKIINKCLVNTGTKRIVLGNNDSAIDIPANITPLIIDSYAFYDCNKLKSVTIGNNVTSIEDFVFNCSGLISITIPDSVTSIGSHAFYGCRGLTSATTGNGVTNIGSSAFENCSSLTSVTIGNNVKSIRTSAFAGCSGLTSVTIPNSVTSIGYEAFNYCNNLTNVTVLPTTPPKLDKNVFPSNVITITVPVGCGDTYKTAAGWSAYADKIVEATA